MMITRDYGSLNNFSSPSNSVELERYTQVYKATHRGKERIPMMNRSFISFLYGGKHIEDFGLLAIIDNNALNRDLSPQFEDIVTESNILNGQFYWSTHFKSNSLNLGLFTDGVTERQLTSFAQWFRPGIARELILLEHPNRGIMARVAAAPKISMLPFEEKVTTTYGTQTSTTLYKGRIDLSFVMDDPFWYAITNFLGYDEKTISETTISDLNDLKLEATKWTNPSLGGNPVPIATDKEAQKIILEDGIPYALTAKGDLFFGIKLRSQMEVQAARVWKAEDQDTKLTSTTKHPEAFVWDPGLGLGAIIGGVAKFSNKDVFMTIEPKKPDVENNKDHAFFYYGGTAPCAPILSFKLVLAKVSIEEGTDEPMIIAKDNAYDILNEGYLTVPANKFAPTADGHSYNTIFVESVTGPKELRITTPSLLLAYNQAINYIDNVESMGATEEEQKKTLIQYIRDGVNHYLVRAAAIQLINEKELNKIKGQLIRKMPLEVVFTINCKTGRALAKYKFINGEEKEEDVGDMIKSNYLLLEDRNYPDEHGYFQNRTDNNPEYSYVIWHDFPINMDEVFLEYKYLYL